ncbi:MAG: PDZ domain-containing protein [Chloroflexi bacterium]|nr:PDZ domain-containing protein [Chloroflexota bacterium]
MILAVDGQPVKDFGDMVTYLARNTQVGQTVNLTVLRQGTQVTVKVTLAARPASATQAG